LITLRSFADFFSKIRVHPRYPRSTTLRSNTLVHASSRYRLSARNRSYWQPLATTSFALSKFRVFAINQLVDSICIQVGDTNYAGVNGYLIVPRRWLALIPLFLGDS
jgi:hypothetical protein